MGQANSNIRLSRAISGKYYPRGVSAGGAFFALPAEPFCSPKFTRCYRLVPARHYIVLQQQPPIIFTVARGDKLVVPNADIHTNYDFFSCQQFFDSLVDG